MSNRWYPPFSLWRIPFLLLIRPRLSFSGQQKSPRPISQTEALFKLLFFLLPTSGNFKNPSFKLHKICTFFLFSCLMSYAFSPPKQKSTSIHLESTCNFWSEWRDSNSRPPAPKSWNRCIGTFEIVRLYIETSLFYCSSFALVFGLHW